MTLPDGWQYATAEQDQRMPMLGEMPNHPLHVKVVATENEQIAAEFAGLESAPIPVIGAAAPVQILQRRYHRLKAYLIVVAVSANSVLYLATKQDSVSSPNPPPTVFNIPLTTTMSLPYTLPVYEAQQPVYAAASVAGIVMSWMDETYGPVK